MLTVETNMRAGESTDNTVGTPMVETSTRLVESTDRFWKAGRLLVTMEPFSAPIQTIHRPYSWGIRGAYYVPPQLFGSFRQKTHQSAVGRLGFCAHSPTLTNNFTFGE